ncbi:MAG: PKD domain-containing protein, partial [Bacteroidia bacterium]
NYGCYGGDFLYIFNGHYAKFWANDSVVCVGDTVRFDQKTRYWTPNCPAPLGAGPPPVCLNEQLSPWDNDPVAIRKTLGWDPAKNPSFIKEQKPEWNYGDGTTSNSSVPGNADKSRPYHVYTKPGVYTVTMITQDSTNCKIATVRKNFIKVIEVKPGFTISNQKDTGSYCGSLPVLKDTSKLVLSPYSKGKYARYVELQKRRDPFTGVEWLSMDTITVDSIISSQWQIGNYTFSAEYGKNVFPPFAETGTFDVKLTSKSVHCKGEIEKKGILTIPSLKAIFQPADSVGCAPFAVTIKLSKSYSPAHSYLWNKGDGTTQTSQPGDTTVTLTYSTPGKYALSVTVTDTVANNNGFDTCRVTYPDTIANPLLPRHHITVLNKAGKPEIKLAGNDSLYSSMAGNKYFWLKDGVLLPDNAIGIRVSQKGDYKLVVWLSNCTSDTSDVYRYDPNSIEYLSAKETGIYVYPNPTTGILTLENANAEITSFELVSTTGQKVLTYNQKLPVGKHALQLASYAKGIYFLNITTKTQVLHLRIVLQ